MIRAPFIMALALAIAGVAGVLVALKPGVISLFVAVALALFAGLLLLSRDAEFENEIDELHQILSGEEVDR